MYKWKSKINVEFLPNVLDAGDAPVESCPDNIRAEPVDSSEHYAQKRALLNGGQWLLTG